MKFRFKLRTFLFFCFLVAVVCGVYGHKISKLDGRISAVKRLSKHWLVDINKVPYQSNRTYPEPNQFRQIVDWPVLYLRRDTHVKRKQNLAAHVGAVWLYQNDPSIKNLSLEGLSKFSDAQELKLYFFSAMSRGIDLDDDEFRHIAKMKNLDRLMIHGCHVSAKALWHLEDLNLKHLSCGSRTWGLPEVTTIGKLKSLRELNLYADSVQMSHLANLTNLERASFYMTAKCELDGIEQLTSLHTLELRGHIFERHIESLAKSNHLKELKLNNIVLPLNWSDKLLLLPALESVEFAYATNISENQKNTLESNGISVQFSKSLDEQ